MSASKSKEQETKSDKKEYKSDETTKEIDLDAPWSCHECKMSNPASSWNCTACYRPRILEGKRLQFKLPETMKGLLKEKDEEGYSYVDMELPEPNEGELLVRSCAVGICGSDAILYKWTKDAKTIAKTPFVPGHETVGLVVKAGKKTRIKPGQRVAIENHFFCEKCYLCEIGRPDICENMSQFGHGKGTKYGGMAQYFIVKDLYCYRLRKNNISWRNASLLEPLGVAYNACMQCDANILRKYSKDKMSKTSKSEYCLVTGCGTIGLLVIGVLKSLNYKNIIAVDIVQAKLDVAKKMGATVVINSKETKDLKQDIMKITNKVGASKIIECSGATFIVNNIFNFVRKGGNIVLVGLPKKDLEIKNPMKEVIFKSVTLRTIHGRRIFQTWVKCEALVSTKAINLDLVMSKKYDMVPLSKYKSVFTEFLKGNEMKIVFDPQK